VADGDGWITIHKNDVNAYQAAREQLEARVMARNEAERPASRWVRWEIADILSLPHLSEWHVWHKRCDPAPDSADDYWLSIERARTYAQVLDLTLHLSSKKWFGATNWRNFVYGRVPGVAWSA
jgi:hypothetical protein